MTHEQIERFKNWLKANRAERDISLEALAKYLNTSLAAVEKWESNGPRYHYIPYSLQYFFDTWENNLLRKCNLDEIPVHPQLATGQWLTWWLDTEGVSVPALADYLGVTTACVYNWKKPETKISILAEYAIRQAMKTLAQ